MEPPCFIDGIVTRPLVAIGDKGPGYDPIYEAWWLHHRVSRLPNTYVSEPELDLEDGACVDRVCGDALAAAERTGEPVRLIGIDAFVIRFIGDRGFARGVSTVVHHLEQIRVKTGAAVMLLRHKSWGNKCSILRRSCRCGPITDPRNPKRKGKP